MLTGMAGVESALGPAGGEGASPVRLPLTGPVLSLLLSPEQSDDSMFLWPAFGWVRFLPESPSCSWSAKGVWVFQPFPPFARKHGVHFRHYSVWTRVITIHTISNFKRLPSDSWVDLNESDSWQSQGHKSLPIQEEEILRPDTRTKGRRTE